MVVQTAAPSDSVSVTDVLAQSGAAPSIVVDPTFAHLNGRQVGRGNVGRSPIREKNAIVNVTFPANLAYVTGGIKMDFSSIGTIERFKQVYLCSTAQLSTVFYTLFVPDVNNDAKLGHLKFFTTTGTEIANGALTLQGLKFKCYIRGV